MHGSPRKNHTPNCSSDIVLGPQRSWAFLAASACRCWHCSIAPWRSVYDKSTRGNGANGAESTSRDYTGRTCKKSTPNALATPHRRPGLRSQTRTSHRHTPSLQSRGSGVQSSAPWLAGVLKHVRPQAHPLKGHTQFNSNTLTRGRRNRVNSLWCNFHGLGRCCLH